MTSTARPDGGSENPRQNVTFASDGGSAHGYLATPPSGSGPGVVVVQEWWGLDDHIAEVVDRLAGEGFVALAPDLFGGRVAHDSGEAGRLMQELPVQEAARALGGAVDYLLQHDAVTSSSVGAVGFCMGGGFVLLLAAVQGHYGERDDFYPVEQARAQEEQIQREAGVPVEFFYYPAGHAFHNDKDKLGTYDRDSAELAWSRTVDFLRANVH